MKINKNSTVSPNGSVKRSPRFKRFIYTKEADKILHLNDLAIKSKQGQTEFLSGYVKMRKPQLVETYKTVRGFIFVKKDYRLPKNPARMLWASLKEILTKNHSENKNDIVVDSFVKDKKKFINLYVTNSKGEKVHEEVVEPLIEKGTLHDLFPQKMKDFSVRYYIVSRVFDALERMEEIANNLHSKDIQESVSKKISAKLLKNTEKSKKPVLTEAKKNKIFEIKQRKAKEAYRKKVILDAKKIKEAANESKPVETEVLTIKTQEKKERIPRKKKKQCLLYNQD